MNAAEWDRRYLFNFRGLWLPDAWIDGDTPTILIDNGMSIRHETAIRLDGFDAPEQGQLGGPEATARLRAILGEGQGKWPARFVSRQRETVVTQVRSFTRYVGDLYVVDAAGELRNARALLEGAP